MREGEKTLSRITLQLGMRERERERERHIVQTDIATLSLFVRRKTLLFENGKPNIQHRKRGQMSGSFRQMCPATTETGVEREREREIMREREKEINDIPDERNERKREREKVCLLPLSVRKSDIKRKRERESKGTTI